MTQQQIINLVVVVLIAGSSAFSWIFRKLQEQAALKRAEAQRERKSIEALRTGRESPEDSDRTQARASAAASNRGAAGTSMGAEDLQRLAERRAQQLRQLREMQLAKQGGTGVPTPPGRAGRDVITSIPGSSGPTVPGRRQPLPATPANTKPSDPGRSRTEDRRAKQAKKAELEALRRAESEALKRTLTAHVPATRLADDENQPAVRAPTRADTDDRGIIPARTRPPLFAGMTRADWKRAFLAKEVLGDPVSMRTDHLR